MDLSEYVQIVTDQRRELQEVDVSGWCDRFEECLFELDSPLAQVVLGVRRSGKSTLCHKILHEKGVKYAYCNFDDERLFPLKAEELSKLLEALYVVYGDFKYLFLDEIQNVERWYLFVNRLLRQKIRMVVTGSNAKLLSGELSTHLTGRYNQIELFPFSFREYLQYRKVSPDDMSTKGKAFRNTAFEDYLMKGGFPELLELKNERAYVQSLFDAIIAKDVQKRFRVRYPEALRKIANNLADNFGQEIIYSDLAQQFNLKSSHTAESYVDYLKQAYLLLGIHKFSFKSRERVRNEKAYLVDMAFISQRDHNFMGQNLGWRLENLVYVELLRRRKSYLYEVFYYRKNYEIDFVLTYRNKVQELIQVSVDITSPKTFKRETSALFRAAEELRCNNLTLITLNEARTVTEGDLTINVVPVIDWLCRPYA